jgi:hypothetical protein
MRTWIAYWFSRFLPLKCLHDRDHSVANLKSPTFGLLKQLEAFLFLVEMVSLFYAGGARLVRPGWRKPRFIIFLGLWCFLPHRNLGKLSENLGSSKR